MLIEIARIVALNQPLLAQNPWNIIGRVQLPNLHLYPDRFDIATLNDFVLRREMLECWQRIATYLVFGIWLIHNNKLFRMEILLNRLSSMLMVLLVWGSHILIILLLVWVG